MEKKFFQVSTGQHCSLYSVTADQEQIDLETAVAYCKTYRVKAGTEIMGYFISRETVEAILNQPEINGIRIYQGLKTEDGKELHTAIVVGTVKGASPGINDDYGVTPADDPLPIVLPIVGEARPCPIHCGTKNRLNS